MEQSKIIINGTEIPLIQVETAVVGSGCAGWNAIDWLYDLGERDIVLITEGTDMGTSRNTGSDKQTYYKLSLAGGEADSVAELAGTLFQGGGVNGDTALAEAAGSVRSFLKLNLLGVPFPTNAYGEFVGYKTDHDPRQRATSAGPLTSKYMTECLERSVRRKNIPILDHKMAFQILVWDGKVQGLFCLDLDQLETPSHGLTLICLSNLILATGGPAICYKDSVYPESQTGMSGMALEAGATGANLHQWQYGLASLAFRWNVSGSYQQVLPRYFSVDQEGYEHEFLNDSQINSAEVLNRIFLKGYQWPFDVNKMEASSWIDRMVWRERNELDRRVFLDFRTDPIGLGQGFDCLMPEAYTYLMRSGALCKTPIARLKQMNPQAIELYREHGIDLETEPLEIGVCAQHHNGGIAVDANWQTEIQGLYAAGEAAGTFGRYRPGGSALNATQVGSMRAAEHIVQTKHSRAKCLKPSKEKLITAAALWLNRLDFALLSGQKDTLLSERQQAQEGMSRCAAHIRSIPEMKALKLKLEEWLKSYFETHTAASADRLPLLLKNRDMLLTQAAVLDAMLTAAAKTGSEGSALIWESKQAEGTKELMDGFSYLVPKPLLNNHCLVTRWVDKAFRSEYKPVRPIPEPDRWFETVWKNFQNRF